jgi:hypothetical protein
MTVTFVFDNPAMGFTSQGVEFRSGYTITNSEVGESGLLIADTLQIMGTPWKCLGYTHRQTHAGRKFAERLRQSFLRAFQPDKIRQVCQDAPQRLAAGLDFLDGSKVSKVKRQSLAEALQRRKIDQIVAREAVYDTIYCGIHTQKVPTKISLNELRGRTCLDLLGCLLRRVEPLPPSRQREAERVAYNILTGKFTV